MPLGLSAGTIAGIGAGVSGVGSLVSGIFGSSASSAASKAQLTASQEALQSQNAEEAHQNLLQAPYIENGDNAQTLQNQLIGQYGNMVTPYLNQLTSLGTGATAQATLEQTPGYQFTLAQGLKSTQNAAAARGLGVSGAALKGAATYSTGLADNTYQQQYSDASNNLTQASNVFQNQYGDLGTQAQLGGNVAVQQGTQAQGYANSSNNLITGGGNATASGIVGSSNALTGGLSGVGTAISNYGTTSNALNMTANQNLLLQNYLGSSGSQYAGTAPVAGTTANSAYPNGGDG